MCCGVLALELNAAKELRLAGHVSSAHIECDMEPVEFGGSRLVFTAPVAVDINYSFDGEGFGVNGVVSSVLHMHCTKCNAEFDRPFTVPFNERFLRVSEQEAEELECYTFSGEVLQLDKMVLDLILLNVPLYGLCKPGCRGLCPTCGANLNNSQCACSEAAVNPAFASLKELAQLLKDQ